MAFVNVLLLFLSVIFLGVACILGCRMAWLSVFLLLFLVPRPSVCMIRRLRFVVAVDVFRVDIVVCV